MASAMKNSVPVAVGRQHLETVEAVGALPVRRTPRDAEGEPGQRQRGGVDQHVAGVCQQRQRARQHAAHRLYHHETAGQQRHPADPGLIVRPSVSVAVAGAMIVTVGVVVAHLLTLAAREAF
jgi:hypothetical protein